MIILQQTKQMIILLQTKQMIIFGIYDIKSIWRLNIITKTKVISCFNLKWKCKHVATKWGFPSCRKRRFRLFAKQQQSSDSKWFTAHFTAGN